MQHRQLAPKTGQKYQQRRRQNHRPGTLHCRRRRFSRGRCRGGHYADRADSKRQTGHACCEDHPNSRCRLIQQHCRHCNNDDRHPVGDRQSSGSQWLSTRQGISRRSSSNIKRRPAAGEQQPTWIGLRIDAQHLHQMWMVRGIRSVVQRLTAKSAAEKISLDIFPYRNIILPWLVQRRHWIRSVPSPSQSGDRCWMF